MMQNKTQSEINKYLKNSLNHKELETICHEMDRIGIKSIVEYFLYLHKNRYKVNAFESDNTKSCSAETEPKLTYETELGEIYCGDAFELMQTRVKPNSVDLIITSPPFGLLTQKKYGNENALAYLDWFRQFADGFKRVLKSNGSLVIDIGGTWIKGKPTRSLYHFELLIMLCREYGFHLAQEFYWWNPAKLPSPAEWVNIRRVRVKDAVNCVWWLSLNPYPKASNRRVLQPYSKSMVNLLKNGYKSKLRPSGHDISDNFNVNNKGAIPPNLLAIANTESNSSYQRFCRNNGLTEHPARFPAGLPKFFVSMLTDKNDLVLDPFAGSCVTGEVCEKMYRRWICCDLEEEYTKGAQGRFININGNNSNNNNNAKKPQYNIAPYEIFPPNSLHIDDKDTPLVADGGYKRPRSNKEELK